MAAEEGAFTLEDVIEGVNRKMIRRHPHVFGDDQARSAGVSKGFWEANKAKERAAKGEAPKRRTLDGIPLALPGLTRALKLQAKAAKVGFDWPHVDHVYDKLAEEVAELTGSAEQDKRAEELGDMLFVLANLARHYGVDPEAALRGANAKFERRFQFIEDRVAGRGRSAASCSRTSLRWMRSGMPRRRRGCERLRSHSKHQHNSVIPAEAGIQVAVRSSSRSWGPAFAGVTVMLSVKACFMRVIRASPAPAQPSTS